MADSGALRARRHRQHVAGNHALCRAGCGGTEQIPEASPQIPEAQAGSPELDPHSAMQELAAQLRLACAANPADAVLAREYRLTLQALTPPKDADDELSDLLASMQR